MYFVSMNNLLTECVDYTLVILELLGEKNLKRGQFAPQLLW